MEEKSRLWTLEKAGVATKWRRPNMSLARLRTSIPRHARDGHEPGQMEDTNHIHTHPMTANLQF